MIVQKACLLVDQLVEARPVIAPTQGSGRQRQIHYAVASGAVGQRWAPHLHWPRLLVAARAFGR